jgi:purine catabolism regulator
MHENQTDRPDVSISTAADPAAVTGHDSSPAEQALPTMSEILGLDLIVRGDPMVLTGDVGLANRVRWVHVAADASTAGLLDGGELLLSTGVGWPVGQSALRRYLTELLNAGIAGLIIELGQRFTEIPDDIIRLCSDREVPLVALQREIRFVRLTEQVHRRIIAEQMEALSARDRVHAQFAELSLRGSPADFIVDQLGAALSAPVVLENLDHEVIAWSATMNDDQLLTDWEERSRRAHATAGRDIDDASWLVTPVEARGTRWGHLIALPGDPHPAGRRMVLEQAAVALALSRLADGAENQWVRHSQRHLLDVLLGGRYRSEAGMTAQFESAGLPIRGRQLLGIGVRVHGDAGSASTAIRRAATAVEAASVCSVGTASDGTEIAIAAISLPPATRFVDLWVTRFGRALSDELPPGDEPIMLALGKVASDTATLGESLVQATRNIRGTPMTLVARVQISRPTDSPFEQLLLSLRADPRVQSYVQESLRPLIDYDRTNGGDLVRVLWAYVNSPGNRSRAAQASLLSRSVFYQRVALIEDLLGVDLADGATVTALHAALFGLRSTSAPGGALG